MARILLQTTIPPIEDDWHVGRFSLLARHLAENGHTVTARDRERAKVDDPVLSHVAPGDFDEIWIMAVDTGDGITANEAAALSAFHERGGALLVTRDHMDLGSSVCGIKRVGAAHHFHSKQPPFTAQCIRDDPFTQFISWPNYHSGSNGDVQTATPSEPTHEVLRRADGATLRTLPAHPHEGAVSAPASDPQSRIVAYGRSTATGKLFNLAVAFADDARWGRGWAESSFHHFADYNWNIACGCPSFVTETPGNMLRERPELLADTKTYVANLAAWLAREGG